MKIANGRSTGVNSAVRRRMLQRGRESSFRGVPRSKSKRRERKQSIDDVDDKVEESKGRLEASSEVTRKRMERKDDTGTLKELKTGNDSQNNTIHTEKRQMRFQVSFLK